MNRKQFEEYIKLADFRMLFNELGWDNIPDARCDTSIDVDDINFEIKAVSEKRGLIVYYCDVEDIPQNSICRKLDMRLRKRSNDYILIFKKPNSVHHLWLVPIRTTEKRDLVTVEYSTINQSDFLYHKLEDIRFALQDEVKIVDVTSRIHKAFEVNSGKITKDFYAGFKKQHNSFVSFIEGIEVEGDRQWYASVMLNRLMFCYFIQKKGFLNFDEDYLRRKLTWVKEQRGDNQFFRSFYKGFLCAFFHGGLNSPVHDNEFKKVYGQIPYLNGGMFDEHLLEQQYEELDIADEAFETLFDFFDKWRWHLDTRITATGKDINPDVLGYIFEQYINDRAQMGAYYTKEDITEYISKNCIIPFLMDEVAKTQSANDFKPNGFVWQTLKNSGDTYIYDAVKKGVEYPLPDYIEQGIDTSKPNLLERRARWNEKAFETHALPTEIWRETVERRNRYFEIQKKIDSGEIVHINDFITYNLDIRSFVYELLRTTSNHLFIKHFYTALQHVTILDPTCGSGAFLFAALNILEPLYEICIERMEEFNKKNNKLFVDELREIVNKYRSNIQYFIYKSIILRNLYGVDIMAEATEIAKLRLFLKMVAVVDVDRRADNLGLDPLPDIDFNIRCGNTLVGYANEKELIVDLVNVDMFAANEFRDRIETEMQKVAKAYDSFKKIQIEQNEDIEQFKRSKYELKSRLSELNYTLSKKMYGSSKSFSFEEWLKSHQPFHWLAEFYQIIHEEGGFDVIIGNPPYVGYTRKNKETGKSIVELYNVGECKTLPTSNLYAFTMERSYCISNSKSTFGMIVPISAFSNSSMFELQSFIKNNFSMLHLSTFHQRPAQLFDGVLQRLCIFILSGRTSPLSTYSSQIYRWNVNNRDVLFRNMLYVNSNQDKQPHFLKLGSMIEINIFDKYSPHKSIANYSHNTQKQDKNKIFYRTAGGGYWVTFLNSEFDSDSLSNKSMTLISDYNAKIITVVLNSNLFWWYYAINYDLFNFKDYMIFGFQFDYHDKNNVLLSLIELSDEMENFLRENAEYYTINSKTKGANKTVTYRKDKSKHIMNAIDKVLARHYGFTEEELDFIINYDIKYRMGSELDNEE